MAIIESRISIETDIEVSDVPRTFLSFPAYKELKNEYVFYKKEDEDWVELLRVNKVNIINVQIED